MICFNFSPWTLLMIINIKISKVVFIYKTIYLEKKYLKDAEILRVQSNDKNNPA